MRARQRLTAEDYADMAAAAGELNYRHKKAGIAARLIR